MELEKLHFKQFGREPIMFFSPGNLKLMGDYIAHTGGSELSCLLNVGVNASVTKGVNREFKFYINETRDEFVCIDYKNISFLHEKSFSYLTSIVIEEITKYFRLIVGVEGFIHFEQDFTGIDYVPSYISLIVKIINHFNFLDMKDVEINTICTNAYNKYMKKNTTLNTSIFNSCKNKALLIDERKDKHSKATINFEDFSLLILYDTNINEDTEFLIKERINDSISAHMIVDSKFKHEFLSDFSIHELNECKDEVRDFEFKRIRHAISENNRVSELFNALDEDDIVKVGMIFTQSQVSLVQDYEISSQQQDTLCTLVSRYNALGAKMISSEQNNSVFVLVKDLQIPNLIKQVSEEYKKRFNSELKYLITNIYQ